MNGLEMKVTRDEAVKAVERCLAPSKTDADTLVVTGAVEIETFFGSSMLSVTGGAVGMFELSLPYATSIIDDEDTCDLSWNTHALFGECLHVEHQCAMHPDDPTDRKVIYLVSVRRSS